jgi:hypothetical protein
MEVDGCMYAITWIIRIDEIILMLIGECYRRILLRIKTFEAFCARYD